jgi:hypothetical protein
MIRRIVVCLLITTLVLTVSVAEAQKTGKVSRIGYLRSGSARDAARYGEGLRQGLRELGYLEVSTRSRPAWRRDITSAFPT